MGNLQSLLRDIYFSILAFFAEISASNKEYDQVLRRVRTKPPVPSLNPTTSFWTQSPPHPSLVTIQSDALSKTADIVIIGSGITGAAIARTLLNQSAKRSTSTGRDGTKPPMPRIVMLEARQVCNGATGRNGGHMKITSFEMYAKMKKKFGPEAAKRITTFQARHCDLLVRMAEAEGWAEVGQVRKVDTVDFLWDDETWKEVEEMVIQLQEEMPELAKSVTLWEREEAIKEFHVSSHVRGAVSYPAGAVWPYRLITSIFATLLKTYPGSFTLETLTPVTSISTSASYSTHSYVVHTHRGHIHATHVIHATNGHAASLLPGLIDKMVPCRAQMSAQRPGQNFKHKDGSLSWGFASTRNMEYMTQIPSLPPNSSSSQDETQDEGSALLLGGALFHSGGSGLAEVGVLDDSSINLHVGSYLSGMLPIAFGKDNWGPDDPRGRIKDMWTGILGFTVDLVPYVGRVDGKTAGGRYVKPAKGLTSATTSGVDSKVDEVNDSRLAPAGEWISAGYNGEGMVNAWLCGVGVALMALGLENEDLPEEPGMPGGKVGDWLPEEYLFSRKRLDRSSIYEFALIF